MLLWGGYLTREMLDPPRRSGGKLIAAYSISNDGKLKAEMSRLRELEIEQEQRDAEIIAALMAWWSR